MMSNSVSPIRPELLAAKIEKLENFELPELDELKSEPRLIRALWYLQHISQPRNYPGGLSKFALDLIEFRAADIGTASMIKFKERRKYEPTQAAEVWSSLPASVQAGLINAPDPDADCFSMLNLLDSEDGTDELELRRIRYKKELGTILRRLTPESLRDLCIKEARENLAQYLKEACELPHFGLRATDERPYGAPWYFASVADSLLAFIEARAASIRAEIAETEITKLVSRWIGKSRSMRRSVMFIGNSRFGKTEVIKVEADAEPGCCRLVKTPASDAMADMLREVAMSLGLEVPLGSAGHDLRERISYVLRFSRLQLLFDECQQLLPGNYSRTTAPARLNWVRRSVMDENIPAIFVCTPQSYLPAKSRFIKKTGFAMEQFDERILKTVRLPDELAECDLLAVARLQFGPAVGQDYLRYVVEKAIATERNFVSDIEKIASLAKDSAREHSRKQPILSDIESAMADVLPTAPAAPTLPTKAPATTTFRRPCKRVAKPIPARRTTFETAPIPSRGTSLLMVDS